jgi:Insulinase (Peptidase family M16)
VIKSRHHHLSTWTPWRAVHYRSRRHFHLPPSSNQRAGTFRLHGRSASPPSAQTQAIASTDCTSTLTSSTSQQGPKSTNVQGYHPPAASLDREAPKTGLPPLDPTLTLWLLQSPAAPVRPAHSGTLLLPPFSATSVPPARLRQLSSVSMPRPPSSGLAAMPVHREPRLRSATLVTAALETPSLDDRRYRVIRLLNELEALLVQDAETDKASAALDVDVGHYSDPEDMPGMAHAVEHVSTFPSTWLLWNLLTEALLDALHGH